jgi:hypothetical protein
MYEACKEEDPLTGRAGKGWSGTSLIYQEISYVSDSQQILLLLLNKKKRMT